MTRSFTGEPATGFGARGSGLVGRARYGRAHALWTLPWLLLPVVCCLLPGIAGGRS
jgi:hypothetical protein